MRILILTFYFRPDLSAGSFRSTALVDALRSQLPPGSQVDVITTLPNRYSTFSTTAPALEVDGPIRIRRVPLPGHKSGMRDQSVSFLSFARGVMSMIRGERFDVVYATSSRLMTAVLGAEIARRTHATLYLDIRDIFADTIKDVLRGPAALIGERVFSVIERQALRRADVINVVSPGFLPYFRARYPKAHLTALTNGIDEEFLAAAPTVARPAPRRAGRATINVLYAGNIGEGQGLHSVVPQLAQRLGDRVRFTIIGDGGRRALMQQTVAALGATNVEIRSPIGRAELITAYQEADVLFLHLNDYPAFEKVLPSKVFEYAAIGKPIWAGVGGYAADFTRSEIANAAVFSPCDVDEAVRALDSLVLEDRPRTGFIEKYSRRAISERLAADLVSLGGGKQHDR